MAKRDVNQSLGARRAVYTLIGLTVAGVVAVTLVVVGNVGDLGSDAVVGLVSAFVTGGVSVVVTSIGHLNQLRAADEREAARYEENVIRALDYFTHGSQRRNVGISVVEGAWDRALQLRPVLVPLLLNQGVYLLDESEQTHSRHEAQNLVRIMALAVAAARGNEFDKATFEPLVDSLQRRRAVTSASRDRGVDVSPGDLERWLKALPEPPVRS